MASAPYRVVQWATGNIGLRSLRAVIEHPDLELVGLYVYSDAKAGNDAGQLCGLAPVGVSATRDVDEILQVTEDYRRTAGFALSALQQGQSLLDEPY